MAQATGGSGGQSAYNNQVATLISSATDAVDPFVEVTYTSSSQGGNTQVTTNTVISGANTKTLTIKSNRVGIQTVSCRLTHPTSGNSPLTTSAANFETISAVNLSQSIISSEICLDTFWDGTDTFYKNPNKNLFLGPLQLVSTAGILNNPIDGFVAIPELAFVVYSTEENIPVKITLSASAGQSFNGNVGGEGGRTIFTYTLQKNVEYVFKLGATVEPTSSIGRGGAGAYFYEKGRLLVACGGGGASGNFGGNGGAGGGAGIVGANGTGTGGGRGGIRVNAGQLTAAGLLSSGINGGKIESCTSGLYWKNRGISPCSDVGQQKFRTTDGSIVTPSATLQRGYKSAPITNYGFRHNGGNSATAVNGTFVGGGGAGAYGGSATTSASAGGGGASGYTNGSVNILSSTQGGSASNLATATIELI